MFKKVYLSKAEEELELFCWFSLATGADNSLRKRGKGQEHKEKLQYKEMHAFAH